MAFTINGPSETAFNICTRKNITFTGTGEYQKCVIETMIHEFYHKYCNDEWGGLGVRANHSDSDGLPDIEENIPTPYKGAGFPPSLINNADTYSYAYSLSGSDDYSDQEVRCRIVELKGTLK